MNDIASPSDIPTDFANAAFNGTSYSPEKRGYLYQNAYAGAVNDLYHELQALAKTPQQQELLKTEIERFRQGYRRRMISYLGAHSRVISPMITGPANFPVRRNQKRGATADRRWREIEEWAPRASNSIRKKLLALRPQEEVDNQDFNAFTRSIARSLETIGQIDRGETQFYNRAAFTTSITGKITRLSNTNLPLAKRVLAYLRDNNYPGGGKKPAISPRNGLWKILTLEPSPTPAVAEPELLLTTPSGVELRTDPEENRIRIVFPSIPDPQTRARLKSTGWRWSPTNGAWQRKLTNNAIYAGKTLLETL